MITRVSNVLIANTQCPASYTDANNLNAGELALFDESGKVIKNEDEALAAKSVIVGICKGIMKVANPTTGVLEDKKEISFSNPIQKGSVISSVTTAYSAPVKSVIKFDLSSATIVVGHRYVVRIVYKDIHEAPGQFTHTYEVFANTTTNTDLLNAFVRKINNHPNRRVIASAESNKLVITALDKTDSEGVNSLNEYTIVDMDASMYVTIPGALLSNVPASVPGVTVEKTEGKPGNGFWKQVRDRESFNMGYKGHVFTGAYPTVEQDKIVNPSLTYDSMIIEYNNSYVSPDNQYVKTSPLTVELYVKAGSLANSQFAKNFKAFVTNQKAPAAAASAAA